ncbi:uncharacterized protein BKA78DRAFT_309725 [Phyllosticta capitalensis]|uniref:uncharacterized protein n=1 Tax=Phyllosticta capitalensis TaxID=121624 RepID=UPI0031305930
MLVFGGIFFSSFSSAIVILPPRGLRIRIAAVLWVIVVFETLERLFVFRTSGNTWTRPT